jgi:hypothetical protein
MTAPGPVDPRGPLPVDLITSLYLAASAGLAIAFSLTGASLCLLASAYAVGAILAWKAPPWLRSRKAAWIRFLCAWYPVLCFTPLYTSTALLNGGSPIPSLDPWLAHMDELLFQGSFCDLFSSALPHQLFAEVMALSYFSYYLMIPGVGLFLWFRNRQRFFEFVFCTAFCFYFFYLIFSLVPSEGPQFFLRGGALHWDGRLFGPLLTGLLQQVEVPTGAFPSSHVGIALICLVFAWRQHRLFGAGVALFFSGLCAAILYGGPHYFIDLPCGLAVALLFILFSGPVRAWLTRKPDESGPPPRSSENQG